LISEPGATDYISRQSKFDPRSWSTRTKFISALAVTVLLLLTPLTLLVFADAQVKPNDDAKSVTTVEVVRGDITETVTAGGMVQRVGVVDLSFPAGGTVTSVNVEPGDTVSAGAVLATVDDTSAQQNLATAESTMAKAVQSGASNDASVSSASVALANSQRVTKETNKRNKLTLIQARESLVVAQNQWDESCLDPNNLLCPNPSAQSQLKAAQASVDSAQRTFDTSVEKAVNNAVGYDVAVNQAGELLQRRQNQESKACEDDGSETLTCTNAQTATVAARHAQDNAVRARITGLLVDQQAQQTASLTLASANVALQQSQVNLGKSGDDAVRSARQALDSAKAFYEQGKVAGEQSVSSAQSALTSAKASQKITELPDGENITSSQAAIVAAQTGIDVAQQTVDNASLVAPFAGIIGTNNYEMYETVSAANATPGITVIPDGPLEVVADLATADQRLAELGDNVVVTFPDGTEAAGEITSVGSVATAGGNSAVGLSGGSQATESWIPVVVTLNEPGLAEPWDSEVVDVSFAANRANDVLTVPVTALLALAEGGYAVEVFGSDNTRRLVAVDTGLFAQGRVEVTGDGISAGTLVIVPTS
jgi:multidrug efflux pump subunit AcrA (membrane-fusion protein)